LRIGVLTGGGDAPGLNAVINALLVKGEKTGWEIIGIPDGWKGLMEKQGEKLTSKNHPLLILQGGTILGSSRTNPYKEEKGVEQAKKGFAKLQLDALIAIGGDDTLGVAQKLAEEGLPIIGVPKTIDNDLSGTDSTIGFDTSVNIIMKAIQDLHTTAKSHHRTVVVEVMGRHSGWMTLVGGLAGGAHLILIPEVDFSLQEVFDVVIQRTKKKQHTIIAVAEGIVNKDLLEYTKGREELDAFGNIILAKLGIGEALTQAITKNTDSETRYVVLGHLQRAGPPSAFDRYFGTRLGSAVIDFIKEKQWGKAVVLRGNQIIAVPIQECVAERKTVPPDQSELASTFKS
jgi:6-phosphofructokinase 1